MTFPILQPNGWFPSGISWAEYISRHAGSPSGGTSDQSFAYADGNQAGMSIFVGWNDVETAIADLLGINKIDPNTGNLSRQPPMPHPLWQQLRCSKISSVKPVQWSGTEDELLEVPGSVATATASVYNFFLLTCIFTQPKFRMLDDATLDEIYGTNPRQEWQRWLEYVPQPATEVLSREQGDIAWAEGPAMGQPVKAPTPQFLTKTDMVYKWRNVPYQPGVLNNNGVAAALEAAVNCVNNADFLGQPKGTLLFKSYKLQPIEDPVKPLLDDDNLESGSPALVCDVELVFGKFDPPAGAGTRGWVLSPYTDGKWYAVSSGSPPTGQYILNSASFPTIFMLSTS
jgi:hypothetical protein